VVKILAHISKEIAYGHLNWMHTRMYAQLTVYCKSLYTLSQRVGLKYNKRQLSQLKQKGHCHKNLMLVPYALTSITQATKK